MTVQFILGRAGSGKTQYCLEAIRERLHQSQRGPALLFLVPEQSTYQVERALVTTPGVGGYCRAQVLSFRRLAHEVFLEVGGVTVPALESAGKHMVLRSILRHRASQLRVFEKSARQRGFIERLAATIGELHAYSHGASRLGAQRARLETRGEGQTLLAAKLHDLALVLDDYEQFFAGHFADPGRYLDLLAERLATQNRFHNARVWVDGFASFTGQEERVLGALMQVANEMHIALCLDPAECGPQSPAPDTGGAPSMFALLRETFVRLQRLARESGLMLLPPLRLPRREQPTRFENAPDLARLERRFFAPAATEPASDAPARSVTLTAAADQRCEVRAAAREILRLCRDERYRFREIAVIVRDLTPYRALLETIFTDFEIPHFLDVRRDVAHHPLVEMIRAALDVAAHDWRSRDVLRFAKTDLVPLDRSAIDRLENYVLAHGIEGDAWHRGEPWQFHRRYSLGEEHEPDERATALDAINQWRRALASPLHRLHEALRAGEATVSAMCRALFGLLEDLDAAESLETWATRAERAGQLDEADEHLQVWDAVVDLLDQAVAALGNERVELDEFREIIEAGLAGVRLRLVPPALDQVLVGSVERSRHPAIRAAFVLGMNERVFPRPHLEDVVFTDRERDRLGTEGLQLGPVSEKRLLHERFLAYIALTRPSERLYVSYAEADPMGRVLHPSPFLEDLRRSCPGLAMKRAERDETFEEIGHARAAMAGLAAALRSRQPIAEAERDKWLVLYNAMRSNGRLCEPLTRRVGGFAYDNKAKGLGRRLAERLYGAEAESSVSRLECFAACPFRHFARYGLRLEERLRFRLERLDLGLLYHEVLKEVFLALADNGPLDWAAVDPQRAVAEVNRAVDRLAPTVRSEILLSSARHRYLVNATRAALGRLVEALIEASRRDRFQQIAAEIAFGRDGEALGPLEIDLAEDRRMRLRGRIDRVDAAGDDPRVLRVIDYKSRPRTFPLNELAHGLSLQLPAYLLAIERNGGNAFGDGAVPAGALYVPILRGFGSETPGRMARDAAPPIEIDRWKARGFFDFRWAPLFDAALFEGDEEARRQASPVVQLQLTRQGQPWKRRHDALVEEDALAAVLRWTERQLAELGRRTIDGETAVLPYQLGSTVPCRWCEFRAVCRFDAQRQSYNVLQRRDRDAALNWIGEQVRD